MVERRVESETLDFSLPETESQEVICETRVRTTTGDQHVTDAGSEDSSNPAEKMSDEKKTAAVEERRSCGGSCLSGEDHEEGTTEEHQHPVNVHSVTPAEGAVTAMHSDPASPAGESHPACRTQTQTSDCTDEDRHTTVAALRETEFLTLRTHDSNQKEEVAPPCDRAEPQQLFSAHPPEQADADTQDQIQEAPRATEQSEEEKMLYHSVLHEMQQQQKHKPGRKFRKKTLMKMAKLFVIAKEWESKAAQAADGPSVVESESSEALRDDGLCTSASAAPEGSNNDCNSRTEVPAFLFDADLSLQKAAAMILQRTRKKRAAKFPVATEISCNTPTSAVEVPQAAPQSVTEPKRRRISTKTIKEDPKIPRGSSELPASEQEATASVCPPEGETSKPCKKTTNVSVKNGIGPKPSAGWIPLPVCEAFMASSVGHKDAGIHGEDPPGTKSIGAVVKVKKKTGQTSRKKTKTRVLPVAHHGEIMDEGKRCDITVGEAVFTQQPPLFEASCKGKKKKKETCSPASGKQRRGAKSKPVKVPAQTSAATSPQPISHSTESTPVASLVSTDEVQTGNQHGVSQNVALKTRAEENVGKQSVGASEPNRGQRVVQPPSTDGVADPQIETGFSSEAPFGLTPAITSSQFQDSQSQADNEPSSHQPQPGVSFCNSAADQRASAGLLAQTPEPTCESATPPVKKKSRPRKSPAQKAKNPKTLNSPVKDELYEFNLQHDTKLGAETTWTNYAAKVLKGKGQRASMKGKPAKAKKVQSGNQDSTAEDQALKTEPQKKPRKKRISAPKPKCNAGQQVQTLSVDGDSLQGQTETGLNGGLTPTAATLTSSQLPDSQKHADDLQLSHQPEAWGSVCNSAADQRASGELLVQTATPPVKKKSRPRKSPAQKAKNPKTLNSSVKEEIYEFDGQHDTKLGAETTWTNAAAKVPKGKVQRASLKEKPAKAKKAQSGNQDSTAEDQALKTEPQKKPRKKRISAPKPKCNAGQQVQTLSVDGVSLQKQMETGFSTEAADGLTPAITSSQFQDSHSQADNEPSSYQPQPGVSFCNSAADQRASAGLLAQTPEPTCESATPPVKKKSRPRKSPAQKIKNPKTLNSPVKEEIYEFDVQHDTELGAETTWTNAAANVPKGKVQRASLKGKTVKAKRVQSGNQDSTAEHPALKTETQKKPRKKRISAPKPKCNAGQQVQTLSVDGDSLQEQMQTGLNGGLTPTAATLTKSQLPDSDNLQLSHQPEAWGSPCNNSAELLAQTPDIETEPTFKSEAPPAKKKRISKTSPAKKAKNPIILNSPVQENCDCVMCSVIIPEPKLGQDAALTDDAGTPGKGKGAKASRKGGTSKAKTKKTLNLDSNIKSDVSAPSQVDFPATGLKNESDDSFASVIKTMKTQPFKKSKTAKKQVAAANNPTVPPADSQPVNAGTTGEPAGVLGAVCKPAEKPKRRKKPKLEPGGDAIQTGKGEKTKRRKVAAAKRVVTSDATAQGESAQPDEGLVSQSQVGVSSKRRRTKKAAVSEAGGQSDIPGEVLGFQNIFGNLQNATVTGNQERMPSAVTDEQQTSDRSEGFVSAANPEETTKVKRKKKVLPIGKRKKVAGIVEEVGKVAGEIQSVQSGFATPPTVEKEKKKRARKRAPQNLELVGSGEGLDEAQIPNPASSNQNLQAAKAKVRKRYKRVKLEFSSVQNNVSETAVSNPVGDVAASAESPDSVTGLAAVPDPDGLVTSYLKETRTAESKCKTKASAGVLLDVTPQMEKDTLESKADCEAEKVTPTGRRKVVKSNRNVRQTTKKKAVAPEHEAARQQEAKSDAGDLVRREMFDKTKVIRKRGAGKASKSSLKASESTTVEDAAVKATTSDGAFSNVDSAEEHDERLLPDLSPEVVSPNQTVSPGRKAKSTRRRQNQTAGGSPASPQSYALSFNFFNFIAGEEKNLSTKESIKAASRLRPQKAKLQKHIPCSFCGRVFRHISALTVHKRIHTGEKPYRCLTCTKRFAQITQLNAHLKTHRQPQAVCCPCCDGKFKHKRELIVHFRIHVRDSNRSAKAKGAKSLQAGESTGGKPFRCATCWKEFSHRATFRMHRRLHGAGKLHRCTACNKAFCKPASLIAHEKTHWPVKPRVCSVCGESFNRSQALRSHFETHSGVTNFSCSKCDEAFGSFASLRAHQVSAACCGNRGCIDTDGFLVTRGVHGQILKPVYFKCPICKQLFRHWCQYNLHLQTHTSSTAHLCDTCAQNYKQASDIRSHCDACCRHSGEEMACSLCTSELWKESDAGQSAAPQPKGQPSVSSPVTGDRIAAAPVQSPPPSPSRSDAGSLSTNSGPGLCPGSTGGSGQMVRSRSQSLIFRRGGRYSYLNRRNTLGLRERARGQTGWPFSCTECDLEFHFLGSYTDHLQDHASLRPYACPLCPDTFASEENLSSHICERHNQTESMKCRTCGKAFSKLRNFKQHKMLHRGAKSHFCLPCGISFPSNVALETHLKTHRLRLKVPRPVGFVEPFLFPYPCTKCTAKFTSADLLHAHQVCHFEAGKKPEQPPDSIVSYIPNRAADTPKVVSQSSQQKCSVPVCNNKHLFRYPHPDSLYVVPAALSEPPVVVTNTEEERQEILIQSLSITTSANNAAPDCPQTSPAISSTRPPSVSTAMPKVGLKKSNAIKQLKELLLHRSKKSPIIHDSTPTYSTKPSATLMNPPAALTNPPAALTNPPAALTKPSAALTNPSAALTNLSAALSKPSAAMGKPSAALTNPSAAMAKPSAALPKHSEMLTKPSAELTKPSAALTNLSAALSKPSAAMVKPSAAMVKPSAAMVKPSAALAKPSAALPKHSEMLMKPSAALAKPSAAMVKPSAALPKHSEMLMKPSAALAKPSAALPKHSEMLMKPSAALTKPSAALAKPSAALPKHSEMLMKPSAALAKPSAALAKPSAALAKPSAALAKPSAALAKPSAVLVKSPNDAHSCVVCKQRFRDISKLYEHYIIHARGT